MAIDPLMVPYMQRALGGGALTKRDAQGLLAQQANSPFSSGVMQAAQQQGQATPMIASNLGAGQASATPNTPFFGSSPSTGDAGQMAGALANAYSNYGASQTGDGGTSDGGMVGGGANGGSGFGQMAQMAATLYGK